MPVTPKLIRRSEMGRYSLFEIESPFFAENYIAMAISRYPARSYTWAVDGLDELVEYCGISRRYLTPYDKDRILATVSSAHWLLVVHDPFSSLGRDVFGEFGHITGIFHSHGFSGMDQRERARAEEASRQRTISQPVNTSFPSVDVQPERVEPGFYVVPHAMPRSELEALLFATQDSAVLEKFRTLNGHITQYAKPGQLIILSDPQNTQCTREEALLTEAAALVNAALEPMSDEEAAFMVNHHEEIESFLGNGSTAVGVGTAMAGQHLKGIEDVLKELDTLHRTTFAKHQKLSGAEFFAERKRLLSQLDVSLKSLVRRGVGIPEYPKLKTALGISSRSLVHHWKKAGVAGGIPGYATHISGVARASKYMKVGGYIGIGIGAVAGGLEIKDVCRVGTEEECKKVKFVEAGKFGGAVAGSVVAGELAGVVTTAVCPPVAAFTALVGGVICVGVIVGTASVVGSIKGADAGEWLGEKIYMSEH